MLGRNWGQHVRQKAIHRLEDREMPRKKVDLRTLPLWLQYLIALVVVGAVVGLALVVGRDRPIPFWIKDYLTPMLGVAAILVFTYKLAVWLKRKR